MPSLRLSRLGSLRGSLASAFANRPICPSQSHPVQLPVGYVWGEPQAAVKSCPALLDSHSATTLAGMSLSAFPFRGVDGGLVRRTTSTAGPGQPTHRLVPVSPGCHVWIGADVRSRGGVMPVALNLRGTVSRNSRSRIPRQHAPAFRPHAHHPFGYRGRAPGTPPDKAMLVVYDRSPRAFHPSDGAAPQEPSSALGRQPWE